MVFGGGAGDALRFTLPLLVGLWGAGVWNPTSEGYFEATCRVHASGTVFE